MYMVKIYWYMPILENQTLTFEFMEKLGLEMLARVGLYGADLDFRGYSVSQRACEGLWASCHPMK